MFHVYGFIRIRDTIFKRYSCVKNAINKCNILAGLGLVRIVKNSNLGLENAARGLGVDFDCKQYLTEYILFHVYGFIRIRETILQRYSCVKSAINKCMGIILAGLGLVRIVKNSNLGLENAARGLGIDVDWKQYLIEYMFHVYGFIRIRETILTKIFMCEKCYKQMHGNKLIHHGFSLRAQYVCM